MVPPNIPDHPPNHNNHNVYILWQRQIKSGAGFRYKYSGLPLLTTHGTHIYGFPPPSGMWRSPPLLFFHLLPYFFGPGFCGSTPFVLFFFFFFFEQKDLSSCMYCWLYFNVRIMKGRYLPNPGLGRPGMKVIHSRKISRRARARHHGEREGSWGSRHFVPRWHKATGLQEGQSAGVSSWGGSYPRCEVIQTDRKRE